MSDNAIIWLCLVCEKTSPEDQWGEIDMPCEDCGDHPGVKCPQCEEVFDMIFDDHMIEVVN